MTHIFSRRTALLAFVAIIALGLFLRAYHFSDWLHFELDQARDVRVVDDAFDGGDFFDLPLLGPKAGGTVLRLPPAFYYLEYLSAVVFGVTPAGIAAIVMILSVLSIPIFYLFIRRAFSEKMSLLLMLLFSVSAFFVMYGRFAWNPNLIPFFALLGFYALLRAVDHEEMHRGRWLMLSAAALGTAMQMHSLAFVSLPVIAGAFLVLKRPRISWKAWMGSFLIVGILYLPMLLNETATGWANSKAFVEAVTKKSSKEDHPFIEKAIRNVSEQALAGMVVVSGFEKGTFPAIKIMTDKGEMVGWACDAKCDRGKWYGVAAVLVFAASALAGILLWRRETSRRGKDMLVLSGLWFGTAFVLFLPLAYDMPPRFFLISGPIFFILLGALLVIIKDFAHGRRIGRQIVFWSVAALVFSNLHALSVRFDEIARAGMEVVDSPPDRILKEIIRVPLYQQEAIVTFLKQRSDETGYPVYMWSEPQHRRALKYLMERRGIANDVLGTDTIYKEGVYYLVLRAQSDLDDALKKYRVNYEIGQTTSFGTLVMIELLPKPGAAKAIRQDFSKDKPNDSQGLPRYTWREFFQNRAATGADDDQSDEIDEAL